MISRIGQQGLEGSCLQRGLFRRGSGGEGPTLPCRRTSVGDFLLRPAKHSTCRHGLLLQWLPRAPWRLLRLSEVDKLLWEGCPSDEDQMEGLFFRMTTCCGQTRGQPQRAFQLLPWGYAPARRFFRTDPWRFWTGDVWSSPTALCCL